MKVKLAVPAGATQAVVPRPISGKMDVVHKTPIHAPGHPGSSFGVQVAPSIPAVNTGTYVPPQQQLSILLPGGIRMKVKVRK